jgi:hypothetical protein
VRLRLTPACSASRAIRIPPLLGVSQTTEQLKGAEREPVAVLQRGLELARQPPVHAQQSRPSLGLLARKARQAVGANDENTHATGGVAAVIATLPGRARPTNLP